MHSTLVSAASPFLARFFAFLRNKSPAANTASLDRLAGEGLPLTPTSLNQFLQFVYRPVEPAFANVRGWGAAER